MRRASVTMVPEEPQAALERRIDSLFGYLASMDANLAAVLRIMEAQGLRPSLNQTITLTTNPLAVSRNNRRYTQIWLPASQAILIDNFTGGPAAFTLAAGWTAMNLMEGARLSVASGTVTALWECLDVSPSANVL
jgi:hypothetical protein